MVFKAWNHLRDIARIKNYIRSNRQSMIKRFSKKYKEEELDEMISIAKAQIKAEELFDKGFKMLINQDDLRFATPSIIGDYRAERILKQVGKTKVVDLCSGVGSQTISFAKQHKHVLAVEIDERKTKYALKNIKNLDLRNVTIIQGDIFKDEIIEIIKKYRPKVIFCDPARKEKGHREEEIDLIIKILRTYSSITPNLIIEAPPFINIRDLRKKLNENSINPIIKSGFEAEYLSIEFKLRRLTLYFGQLKNYDYSIVELPEKNYLGVNIKDDKTDEEELEEVDKPLDYLIEPNPALTRASIIHALIPNANSRIKILEKGRNTILTTNTIINDEKIRPFIEEYKVIFVKKTNNYTDSEVLEKLRENKAKYVVIKQSIKPEDYWRVRNYYEEKLKFEPNNKILYLFYLKKQLIIAELIPK